jgi:Spy/CpxP family protein refolding chaperone
MKKILLVCALVGGLISGAFAQNPTRGERSERTPEQRAEMRTKRMQESLALSNEQYQKLLAINLDQEKKRDTFRKEHEEKMAANREQLKANHEALLKSYESVLTPEQMTKFKEDTKKRRAEMRDKLRGRRK